ncbi:hypothetical protein, partial [uncultured Roseobacter sp.]|uniref:hypothetical protein n=1 Tax=uncultured Roseobacter sp. TaxID=114847 RepID=UPI002626739B
MSIDVYQAIADGVSAGADADEANATALKAGLGEVVAQAQALFGSSYVERLCGNYLSLGGFCGVGGLDRMRPD